MSVTPGPTNRTTIEAEGEPEPNKTERLVLSHSSNRAAAAFLLVERVGGLALTGGAEVVSSGRGSRGAAAPALRRRRQRRVRRGDIEEGVALSARTLLR